MLSKKMWGWSHLQTLLLSSFVIDIIKDIGFVNKPAPLLYRQVCGVAFEGYLSIWMKIATTNPELLMGNECKWFDMTVFKVIEWNTVHKQRVSANLLLVLYLQSLQLFHLYLTLLSPIYCFLHIQFVLHILLFYCLHFSLFYCTFTSYFFFLPIYIYIYTLVWCYFYII